MAVLPTILVHELLNKTLVFRRLSRAYPAEKLVQKLQKTLFQGNIHETLLYVSRVFLRVNILR